MGESTLTRRAAGSTLALLTAVCAAFTGAAPANASTPAPVLAFNAPAPVALVPGLVNYADPLFLTSSTTAPVKAPATITIDYRNLAKVAAVSVQGDCSVKGTVATCHETLDSVGEAAGRQVSTNVSLVLTPLKSAPIGAQGSYTVSGTSTKARISGTSGTVTIGGPELKLAARPTLSGLRVGSTVQEPIQFTNVGSRPSAGSEVLFELTPGLAFAQKYRNCAASTLLSGYTAELCHFTGTVRLGETLQLATPVALRVTPQALYTGLYAFALPAGDTAGVDGALGPNVVWHQESGPQLGLRVIAAGHGSTAPVGSVPVSSVTTPDYLFVRLTAHNTADFGVWGAKATGKAGSLVSVNVGLYNHGPATLISDEDPGLLFRLPPGTTAVRVPATCGLNDTAVPGVYACGFGWAQTFALPSGEQAGFTFVLKVNKVISRATGTVSLQGPVPFDPNPRNNSAAVTVN